MCHCLTTARWIGQSDRLEILSGPSFNPGRSLAGFITPIDQGHVAQSMVSANHCLSSIKTNGLS